MLDWKTINKNLGLNTSVNPVQATPKVILPKPTPTPKLTLTSARRGKLPTPKGNLLLDAFDKEENYVDKAKKGNLGGAAANFVGTGLTGAQTLYLNAANSVDSLAQGKGLPKFQPQMGFTDYDKAVAERRGTTPTIDKVAKVNKYLGQAYQFLGEVGTDPLELTPFGYANDIKLAKGVNQNTQAYAKSLQAGKLTGSALPKAPTETPPQASSATVQPRNAESGAKIPQEQMFSEKGGLPKQDFIPLGADTNKYPPNIKTSEFKTNSVDRLKMFDDSRAELGLTDDEFAVESVSWKRGIEEANQRLGADFDGEVADLFNKPTFDGVDTHTAMGITQKYVDDFEKTGDSTNLKSWLKASTEKFHEVGQSLNALKAYERSSPEGVLRKAQQTVAKVEREFKKKNPNLLKKVEDQTDEIMKAVKERKPPKSAKLETIYKNVLKLEEQEKLSRDTVRDLIKEVNGVSILSDNDIKLIVDNMELAAKQTDPYMKKMYETKASQIISNKEPAEFREKFRSLQRISMLLNPKTLITRNPLGNLVLGAAENVKDIPAAAIDKLVSLKTGERTTAFMPIQKLNAQLKGAKQGATELVKDIKYGVDTSPSRGQLELPNKRVFKNEALNKLDYITRYALQFGDRPGYQAAYSSRLLELEKLGKTGDEAIKDANLYALDRVFQNDSELSKRAIQIRKSLGLPGDLVMPFTQTPANILDKLLDYSPAGLGKAVYQLGKTGKGTFDQKKFVDTIARSLTGGGIAMLAYAMMNKGILTGALSGGDIGEAEKFSGQQYYSIKINGEYYSYDWAQPLSGIIAAVADAIKAGADQEDFVTALSEGGVSAIDSVFNQSFLSGLLTAFSGYSPASGIGAALLGSTSQVTPTAGAGLAKTIDTTVRETYDPNILKEQANKLVSRIPLASMTLPAKLDITGQPIQQNQGRGLGSRLAENFLLPYKVSQTNNDPVNTEVMRLQSETGNNSVLLNKVGKTIDRNNQTYRLTADEYIEYQELVGKQSYKEIQDKIRSSSYREMKDEKKAELIQKINDRIRKQVQDKILKNRGVEIK